jgi:Holliday junction resolvase
MAINWIDVAQKAFDLSGKKQMHVDDIAACIQKNSLIAPQTMSTEQIKKGVNSSLAGHVKHKGPAFRKVKNKNKKSFQRGVYALRSNPKKDQHQYTFLDPLDGEKYEKHFRGKAGEYALVSELLFRGYNANVVSVDVGIDIIAIKENKTFHIQVKTSKCLANGSYAATIQQTKFAHANDIYYVVVMRNKGSNEFFIITSTDLRTLKRKGAIGDGENINIRLSLESNKYYLSGKEPVQHHINDFKAIK